MGEIQYLIRLEELGADSASDDGPSSMATYRYCTYDDVPLRLPVGLATTTVLPSTYDFVMGGASRRRLSDSPLSSYSYFYRCGSGSLIVATGPPSQRQGFWRARVQKSQRCRTIISRASSSTLVPGNAESQMVGTWEGVARWEPGRGHGLDSVCLPLYPLSYSTCT